MAKENRYCGPYALAHVNGWTPNQAATFFRHLSGKRAIMRVSFHLMTRALFETNRLRNTFRYEQEPRPTMARWLRQRSKLLEDGPGVTYVVGLTSHYIVVRGNTIWDNQHPEGIHVKDYLRRARVKRAWRVA